MKSSFTPILLKPSETAIQFFELGIDNSTTTASNPAVAVGYNGNQLTQHAEIEQKTQSHVCLNIDFLILNFNGKFSLPEYQPILELNGFKIVTETFGTKTFKNRFTVFYRELTIGTLLSEPRSEILDENLIQFQLENSLFYIYPLDYLQSLIKTLTKTINVTFKSINRLDIALDRENINNKYQTIMTKILNGDFRISGKDKKISPYYVTSKGKPNLTGFTIGKRSSTRFLRVYNKTVEMEHKPKEYILNKWIEAKINPGNVWRYEYQLNNSFFRHLKDTEMTDITYQIFTYSGLVELVSKAEKNHFELTLNTGKSQINKEEKIIINCWETIRQKLTNLKTTIQRIKKIVEPSLLSQKRLLKAVFREYYQSKQNDLSHILALNASLENYPLRGWFNTKLDFYVQEFQKKSVQIFHFDKNLFTQHSQLAI